MVRVPRLAFLLIKLIVVLLLFDSHTKFRSRYVNIDNVGMGRHAMTNAKLKRDGNSH